MGHNLMVTVILLKAHSRLVGSWTTHLLSFASLQLPLLANDNRSTEEIKINK